MVSDGVGPPTPGIGDRPERGGCSACGDAGIRTPCLLRAKQALYQVSYIPIGGASWTRTRGLSLIRTALSPPELMPPSTTQERDSNQGNLLKSSTRLASIGQLSSLRA